MADSNLGPRWRHLARILRGEAALTAASRKALESLLSYTGRALHSAGFDVSALSNRASGWRSAVDQHILPLVTEQFGLAFEATAAGVIDPAPYATRHLEAVWNRLSGVPSEVFDTMRLELEVGRAAGEAIPQLAARVDALLADSERWTNRAVTIARTEVIGANNAGGYSAAGATAQVLDADPSLVVKEWLATGDGRTRPTHAEADGTQVLGLDTPFQVGGDELEYAGDPAGSAAEVVNCRCTVLYHYPGDPAYPGDGGTVRDMTGNSIPLSVATPELAPAAVAHDPGPQSPAEHAARTMTPEDLATQAAVRGAQGTRARAELKRRGLAAAATPQEAQMAEDDTTEEQYGVVVVALPAADDPVQDIGPEQKHATLLYFGDVAGGENPNAGLTHEFRTLVTAVTAEVAGRVEGVTSTVAGVETLGDLLNAVRETLLGHGGPADADPNGEVETVLGMVEQYPSYTPHVTIGYPDDEGMADADVLAAGVESITFDRLALWWAGEQTEWPLATAAPEEAPMDDTVTAAAGDPAPTPPETIGAGEPAPMVDPMAMDAELGDQFYGVCTVEDAQTGDGRVFAPDAINWDGVPFPMPAGWQVQDAPGHDGSVICGRIDTMLRFGPLIAYTGTWDLDGAGWETRRLVDGGFLTGLSVDTDDFDAILVDEDGNPIDPMAMMFEGDMADPILLVQRARVRSWAMCRVPAFVEAFVANGTPPEGWAGERPGAVAEAVVPAEEDVVPELVAAAGRANLPAAQLPALSDYSNPGLTVPTPITVTEDGRVFGHIAAWGTCHIGFDGTCVTPPHSLTGYAHFLKGEVLTDGGVVPVGRITMETGHAGTNLSAGAAAAHYDNTGSAVANICCGDDEVGIWMAGRLKASTTPEQIEELVAAGAVSGDWRRIGGNLELVATLAVNVPGFPIPRVSLAASGDVQMSLVASGIVTPEGERVLASSVDPASIARQAVAIIDRRARAHHALARVRIQRAVDVNRRLAAAETRDRRDRIAAAAARLERV